MHWFRQHNAGQHWMDGHWFGLSEPDLIPGGGRTNPYHHHRARAW